MSISIDDLVSSFSSAHVGQEQSDLAALHAQLAETLFGGSSFASSSRTQQRAHEPCTTPTARSPTTTSFNWADIDAGYRSRSSSISNRGPSGYEDTEDEMMVEELLMPASSSSSAFENTHSIPRTPSSYHQRTPSYSSMTFDPIPSPSSHFTTSDPFYLQTQANAQSYFSQNSNITQRGRPSMASPFVSAATNQFSGYQYAMGVAA